MDGRGIVVSVDFVGSDEFSDVLQIPFDISWADFELVLHLQFNSDDLDTKYVDEEGDMISLSSQEELTEAIEVAKKNNNTLRLKVTSRCACPNPRIHHDLSCHGDSTVTTDAIPVFPTAPPETVKPVVITEERESEEDLASSDCPEDREGNRSDDSGRRGRPIRLHGPDLVRRKKKKLDYFTLLAQDIGRLRKSYDLRPKRLHPENEQHRQENCSKEAPLWFTEYMAKFKQEMVLEVTCKVLDKVQLASHVKGAAGPAKDVKRAEESERNTASVLHFGILCDHCEQPIHGVRYKCGQCPDYDLCEKCELSGVAGHDKRHLLVKIQQPIHGLGKHKSGVMKPLFKKFVSEQIGVTSGVEPDYSHDSERKLKKIKKLEKKLAKTQQELLGKGDKPKHMCPRKDVRGRTTCFDKPNATFVQDVTYPDGCHVYVGQKFIKCWTVCNSGQTKWPADTKLKLLWGNLISERSEVAAPPLDQNTEGTVSVELVAPPKPGTYQSHWRLHTAHEGFGHRLWCHVIVDDLPPDTDQSVADVTVSRPAPVVKSEDIGLESKSAASETTSAASGSTSEAPVIKMEPLSDSDDRASMTGSTSSSVEADLMSAKNKLSCENLAERSTTIPTISQTATPNNTPQVATPPNERDPSSSTDMSRRSSIELVDVEDCSSEVTEQVRCKISDLAIKTDTVPAPLEASPASVSRSSSSSSLSTDSDYYVVPLPDCFDLDKPMTRSLLRTVSPSDDEVLSVDHLVETNVKEDRASPVIATPPCESEAQAEENGSRSSKDACEPVEDTREDATVNPEASEQNDLSGNFNNGGDDPARDVGSDDENIASDCPEDEETELKVDLNATATDAAEEIPAGAECSPPHSPKEIATNLASTVFGVTSQVANKAFSAAKDIFHHLQVQDQYVPPRSTWTPPQNTWTPTPSAWSPQANQWQERSPHAATPMETLIDMGFADRAKNQQLLTKHDNDVQKVLQELLEEDTADNDWHQIRH